MYRANNAAVYVYRGRRLTMEANVPSNWVEYLFGALVAVLLWIARSVVGDVKRIKGSYISRKEVHDLIAAHQAETTRVVSELRTAGELRQVESNANFRELRIRFDTLNDSLLRAALANAAATKPP